MSKIGQIGGKQQRMQNYVPIRLSSLPGKRPLDFDLYIKLKTRFLLYVRQGDDLDPERIAGLKSKKVRKLFISESSEKAYQEFMDKRIESAIESPDMASQERAQIVSSSSENAVDAIYRDPGSSKSYQLAEDAAKKLLQVMEKHQDVLFHIFNRVDEGEGSLLLRHAVNISSLAMNFAKFLGLSGEQAQLLGIAGLMADMGHTQMAPEDEALFFMPVADMSSQEKERYFKHPELAVQAIQDKPFATREIMDLIFAHEEKRSGEGFPTKKKKLTQMEEILSLCASYDRRVSCLKLSPSAVLKNLTLDEVGHYELEMLKSFKKFAQKEGLHEI